MLQHFLGAHPRPLLELPLQIFGAHMNRLGHLRERGLICGMVIQVLDSGGYAPELDVCSIGSVLAAERSVMLKDSPSSRS